MARKIKNPPLIGEAFNPEQMNMGEVFQSAAAELFHYKPKGWGDVFSDLMAGKYAWDNDNTTGEDYETETAHDALNDAESLLSEWAQTVERHDYIYFVVDGPFAGFLIHVESAIGDADWKYSCDGSREHGNPHQPGDGAGLEVFVNDHGNVTAWLYGANGHKREIFSVV